MIILVDENDNEVGVGQKLQIHREGRLHRAFSIFVFNSKGDLMLQQRGKTKYHSGGLWTNTCCGHPKPGETVEKAALRRLYEEMGIDCGVEEIFSFLYQVEFDNGLCEHEYDHVMIGTCDDDPHPDPEEAGDWKWVNVKRLKSDVQANPARYTYWFKVALDRIYRHMGL
jgi:isopentenyl-diphosphate delta-isomerase